MWNEYGDIRLRDKRSKIKAVYKAVPHRTSSRHLKLSVLTVPSEGGGQPESFSSRLSGEEAELLAFQVASIKSLAEEDGQIEGNSIEQIPEGPYRDLLKNHPNLFKQDFNAETNKNGIIHSILTRPDAKHRKAKDRRLLR